MYSFEFQISEKKKNYEGREKVCGTEIKRSALLIKLKPENMRSREVYSNASKSKRVRTLRVCL